LPLTTYNNNTMKLKPEDSGRKVTCKIHQTQIDDGELYYCPVDERFFIFQNERNGPPPESLSPGGKGYKYSWFCCGPSYNGINSCVTEFQFKEGNIVSERLFKDLEEMSECKAGLTDYQHKIFEIINTEEGNRRAILLYKLLSDVRGIGYEDGKRAEKEELLKFLNSR